MLELKKGVDILSLIGRIKTQSEANNIIKKYCNDENYRKLMKIENQEALLKIANAISMLDPDSVFINTGSESDIQKIREMSIEKGEEKPLAIIQVQPVGQC